MRILVIVSVVMSAIIGVTVIGFTNIDELIYSDVEDITSQVEITADFESIDNPFKTYSINTICELVTEVEKNPRDMTDELDKKYAIIFEELGEKFRSEGWSGLQYEWTPSQEMEMRMLDYQKWIELYDANPDIIHEIEDHIAQNLPLSC